MDAAAKKEEVRENEAQERIVSLMLWGRSLIGLWMGIHTASLQLHIKETLPEKESRKAINQLSLSEMGLGMVLGSFLGILVSFDFSFEIIGIQFD